MSGRSAAAGGKVRPSLTVAIFLLDIVVVLLLLLRPLLPLLLLLQPGLDELLLVGVKEEAGEPRRATL